MLKGGDAEFFISSTLADKAKKSLKTKKLEQTRRIY